jgi:hypothetical protein
MKRHDKHLLQPDGFAGIRSGNAAVPSVRLKDVISMTPFVLSSNRHESAIINGDKIPKIMMQLVNRTILW